MLGRNVKLTLLPPHGLVSYLAGNTEVTPVGRCYTNRIDPTPQSGLGPANQSGSTTWPETATRGRSQHATRQQLEASAPVRKQQRFEQVGHVVGLLLSALCGSLASSWETLVPRSKQDK